MSESLEIVSATFYDGREVITPTQFSLLVRGYPSYLRELTKSGESFPALVIKRGKREYYYLDEMCTWYELVLEEKANRIKETAKRFDRAKSVITLKRETNKASRQALLNTIGK
jgi:predicted transcriptional regulator